MKNNKAITFPVLLITANSMRVSNGIDLKYHYLSLSSMLLIYLSRVEYIRCHIYRLIWKLIFFECLMKLYFLGIELMESAALECVNQYPSRMASAHIVCHVIVLTCANHQSIKPAPLKTSSCFRVVLVPQNACDIYI